LVLVFVNSAGIMLLLDVEFMAVVLIVVYCGAIAVLFLFVCMMLDIKLEERHEVDIVSYLPVSFLIMSLFILLIGSSLYLNYSSVNLAFIEWVDVTLAPSVNILALGQLLYTYHFIFFLLCGFILLQAMLGSIHLTLHHRLDVRRQIVWEQLQRRADLTLKNYKK